MLKLGDNKNSHQLNYRWYNLSQFTFMVQSPNYLNKYRKEKLEKLMIKDIY